MAVTEAEGAAAAAAGSEEDDYERKVRFVSAIANPLASRKLTKRVLKTVRKGASAHMKRSTGRESASPREESDRGRKSASDEESKDFGPDVAGSPGQRGRELRRLRSLRLCRPQFSVCCLFLFLAAVRSLPFSCSRLARLYSSVRPSLPSVLHCCPSPSLPPLALALALSRPRCSLHSCSPALSLHSCSPPPCRSPPRLCPHDAHWRAR